MREKILLDTNWRFLPDPPPPPVSKTKAGMYISAKTERLKWGPGAYHHNDKREYWSFQTELNAEPWEDVQIPHDYIIPQPPDPTEAGACGYFKYYPAWYRRPFKLNPEDETKRLTIYFEGITGISDIYLNGCFLKHNDGGYVSFEVDITDLARFDQENVLAVYVNPDSYETWWYAGGGIYRNVWLVKTDTVAVDLWGAFLPVAKATEKTWDVPLQLDVKNIDYEPHHVEGTCAIIAPDGTQVAEMTLEGTAAPRTVTTLNAKTTIDNPKLWDIDDPNIYTAHIELTKDGQPADTYDQTFGFREVVLDPDKGCFLNGRHIKLKGVCGHLDFGLTGKAVPDNICNYKMQLVKQMGANAFRTSHYPHQEAVMEACDRLGILVMDENRRFESCDDTLAHMAMLVKRDRNRPSVFIWSTSNEEMDFHALPQGRRIQKALYHVIKTLDPTRPVTAALAFPDKTIVQKDCDVVGCNYSLNKLQGVHEAYPDKPFMICENCAVPSSRGWFHPDSTASGLLDARDRDLNMDSWQYGRENTWKFIMEHDWDCGGFQWDAFEHRGEAIWPRLSSVSGAIDLFLQPKEAFYQNQSHWLDTPMIHILPHWNHIGLEGSIVNVWIYTNCDEAELFLNGNSLGKKSVEKFTHLEWNVPFEPGTLKAIGYKDGNPVATHEYQTTGKPAKLILRLENGPVVANGQDIALVTCYAVDDQGREVPDATPTVTFDSVGAGKIVGTGAVNNDHVPVPSRVRKMYAGRISVAIKLARIPADATRSVTLLATADNLTSATLVFQVKGS